MKTRNHIVSMIVITIISFTTLIPSSGCREPGADSTDLVVTLPPLKMILDPIVAGRKKVVCLLPPGASPHTYTLSPSRATQLATAEVFFYVDESLDGWAARMAAGPKVALLALVPEADRLPIEMEHTGDHPVDGHSIGDMNPHFWSDPKLVAAMIPALVEILAEHDPDGRTLYESNGADLVANLHALDQTLSEQLAGIASVSLIAFHPSWSYYFKRYGIPVAAYVEPVPGKDLSPKKIIQLRNQLEEGRHVVILSEVQLSRKSAEALAEALGATVGEIDPLGGRPPLSSYEELIRYNTTQLVEVLR